MLHWLDNEKNIKELGFRGVGLKEQSIKWCIESVVKDVRFSAAHHVFCFPTPSNREELWELPIMVACGVHR